MQQSNLAPCYMEFPYLFGVPYNKDYSILGSILGSPYFGKLPYRPQTTNPDRRQRMNPDCSLGARNAQSVLLTQKKTGSVP